MSIEDPEKKAETIEAEESLRCAEIALAKEGEVSSEDRDAATRVILETMGIDSESNLDHFYDKLIAETRDLPRYKELEAKLQRISNKSLLSYNLFKLIKQAGDIETATEKTTESADDGVLLRSMKAGKLECAGRVMIASVFLQDNKIEHSVASAPGHTFVLVELGHDTLGYFDANNNLYFTFPRTALQGYQGVEKISECQFLEYTPREIDKVDGINSVFTHFITMPPLEGVARQYLGNVAAALSGKEEFENSGVIFDKKQALAVHKIEAELLGEQDSVLYNFLQCSEELISEIEIQNSANAKVVLEILAAFPGKKDFSMAFASIIQGALGEKFPYLKNATQEFREQYGEKLWEMLQDPKFLGEITKALNT